MDIAVDWQSLEVLLSLPKAPEVRRQIEGLRLVRTLSDAGATDEAPPSTLAEVEPLDENILSHPLFGWPLPGSSQIVVSYPGHAESRVLDATHFLR